jgi:D-cysteine desulfhydrase
MLRAPTLVDDHDGIGVAPTAEHAPLGGNLLVDRLVGAEVRLITAASYRRRGEVMATVADELTSQGKRPYIIVEGGSNGLGSLGYVAAMAEVREQMHKPFDAIVVACGSGGTAAGIALGAGEHGVAEEVRAIAVCNDEAYFQERIASLIEEARALDGGLGEAARWSVDARFKGPAYGVSTDAQRLSMIRAGRRSGLVLDPVYSGKAFHALEELARAGDLAGKRVLFVHTGGLPGLLAEPAIFGALA